MSLGRPLAALELTAEERRQLSGFAASRSLPYALVARAQLVLWFSVGVTNAEIGERLNWSKPTVGKWRQRFVAHRLQGLDLRCFSHPVMTGDSRLRFGFGNIP